MEKKEKEHREERNMTVIEYTSYGIVVASVSFVVAGIVALADILRK